MRGVPPDVIMPFADFTDDDPESVRDSIKPAIRFFTGLGILLILVVLGTILAFAWVVTFGLGDDGFPK